MTDKTILQRYGGRDSGTTGDNGVLPVAESVDDLGAFGWLRGIRDSARMLELRRKDGNVLAVGYAWLERVQFNPSEGITLCIVGQKIRVTGRNLNAELRPSIRLFEGITRHRVPWLQEADEPGGFDVDDKATVIESIEW